MADLLNTATSASGIRACLNSKTQEEILAKSAQVGEEEVLVIHFFCTLESIHKADWVCVE